MKRKLLNQLCLFSNEQMTEMVELPPEKPKKIPTGNIDTWLQWQLQIGQSLKGKSGREHRAMLTKKKPKEKKVKVKKQPAPVTDAEISYCAMVDCLRDAGYNGADPVSDFFIGNHP